MHQHFDPIAPSPGGSVVRSQPDERPLAPPPSVDRFPIIIGSNITFAYIAAAMRLALSGYRQQQCDLLDELLDHEPHGFSVLSKRVLSIAGARIELKPADAPGQEAEAQEICALVERQFNAIPFRTQAFASLVWGLFYGLAGAEIAWRRSDEPGQDRWSVAGLGFIHSRRLSYPRFGDWELCVYDQGYALGQGTDMGLRISAYPNKFVIFSPRLRGNYPTREGLGRILITYLAIKRLVIRVSAQDFERFVRPWVIAYYACTDPTTKLPRAAVDEDIAKADMATRALGAGSLSSAVLPENIKIELLKAASELSQSEFLEYLDAAISKCVLGQTFTTQSGKFGSRATAKQGKEDTLELYRYDAACFADTLKADLVLPIVRLNRPGKEHLAPTLTVVIEKPDAGVLMDLATKGAECGIPVDGAVIAQKTGLPLANPDDPKAIVMRPKAGPAPAASDDSDGDDDEPDEGDDADDDPEQEPGDEPE